MKNCSKKITDISAPVEDTSNSLLNKALKLNPENLDLKTQANKKIKKPVIKNSSNKVKSIKKVIKTNEVKKAPEKKPEKVTKQIEKIVPQQMQNIVLNSKS